MLMKAKSEKWLYSDVATNGIIFQLVDKINVGGN
jgi:hypothetical protein